jgi:hypothetical protein
MMRAFVLIPEFTESFRSQIGGDPSQSKKGGLGRENRVRGRAPPHFGKCSGPPSCSGPSDSAPPQRFGETPTGRLNCETLDYEL